MSGVRAFESDLPELSPTSLDKVVGGGWFDFLSQPVSPWWRAATPDASCTQLQELKGNAEQLSSTSIHKYQRAKRLEWVNNLIAQKECEQ